MKLLTKPSIILFCSILLLSACREKGRPATDKGQENTETTEERKSQFTEQNSKEVSYQNVSLRIPKRWTYEVEDLDEGIFQLTCEEPDDDEMLILVYVNYEIMDAEEYLNMYRGILEEEPGFKRAKYSPLKHGELLGYPTYEYDYTNNVLGFKISGRMLSFNADGAMVYIQYYSSLDKVKRRSNELILNSLEIIR